MKGTASGKAMAGSISPKPEASALHQKVKGATKAQGSATGGNKH